MTNYLNDVDQCVEQTIARVGKKLVLGAPLGLGKPNQLINAFYRRAVQDPEIELEILTALSLDRPSASSDIEAKFLQPFVERQFGDYHALDYVAAQRKGTLPNNIKVLEFYFKAGSMTGVLDAQCNYISTNYTFAARDLMTRGVNVLVQMVATDEVDGKQRLSLSCNTDVSLDLLPALRARDDQRPIVAIAQIHDQLPFMGHKAMVEDDFFDMVIHNPAYNTTLFATPNMVVNSTDAMIGFRASTLIKDGGTLQIGIGSLGDAITYACQLRQANNSQYQAIAKQSNADTDLVEQVGGLGHFEHGLYGCSEMFVNGFLHLMRSGILTRLVYDDAGLQRLLNQGLISDQVDRSTLQACYQHGLVNSMLGSADVDFLTHWGILRPEVVYSDQHLLLGDQQLGLDLADSATFDAICEHALGDQLQNGILMHGGFFLGPADFYQALRDMPSEQKDRIAMDSVRQINRMDNVELHSLQRQHARFINTGMMVTLSGAVVSDGLESGQVISGVGGQYNFVAQAHELDDARSIICLRSTRGSGKKVTSNIVLHYGHITVPRHLRDIVVTEYGVADLRAKTDAEIVKALINIADSRFQYDLLTEATAAGKIEPNYTIPEQYRNNTPERIQTLISDWRRQGCFPPFPLGTDFTDEEIALGETLRDVKALFDEPKSMLKALIRSFTHDVDEQEAAHYLQRIGLQHPDTPKEVILQHLLLLELEEHGYLRPL